MFAFKTLVASKIYKYPDLITLFRLCSITVFDVNNKVIRFRLVGYYHSTKVNKTKIRFPRYSIS
jgi:hypothetical protein